MAWAAPIAGAVIGGMMNKSAAKTAANQTTTAEPWAGAQPGLNTLYQGAEANYYGGGPQYYPGNTVASQSAPTQYGQQAMFARAMQGSPVLTGAQDQVGRTMNDEYLYSNPALGGLFDASNFDANSMWGQGDLANMGQGGLGDFQGQGALNSFGNGDMLGSTLGMWGLNDIGNGSQLGQTAGLQGLQQIGNGNQLGSTLGMNQLNAIGQGSQMGQTMGMNDLQGFSSGQHIGQTAGTQQLQQIGNGSMLNSNPYVDEMFANATSGLGRQFSNNVMPGVASMFAGAGRYGSEAMQQGVSDAQNNYGDQLRKFGTDIYGQNYANERQQQMAALGQLGQYGLAERGQQLQAGGMLGQLDQNEVAQMMQGAQAAGQFSQNEHAQQLQALMNAGQLSSAEYNRQLQGLQSAGQLSQGERQMQLQGAQSAGQLDAQNRGQRLSALQTLTGNQLQGQSLRNQALGEMSTAHGRERAMQMQAASMAPGLAQADYFDINQMLGLGQQQDAYQQQLINADMQRWDFNENANNNNLAFLNSIMTGAAPYKSTNMTGQQGGGGNVMGGALGGMMLGNSVMNGYNAYAGGGGGGQVPTYQQGMYVPDMGGMFYD